MHQFTTVLKSLDAALKDAAGLNPAFLTTDQVAETLLQLRRIESRVAELSLRVMTAGQELAEQTGARDVAGWLVARGATDARPAHAQLKLAQGLERRDATRTALAEGELGLEHARVIVQVLDDLPADLGPGVIGRAEAHLIELAGQHRPGDLRRLARHLVEVVAPEVADDADARALARIEARAHQRASLSIVATGDGLSRIHGVVPDAVAERLRTYLEAFAQPRLAVLDADRRPRPRSRLMADALADLLETIDPDRLPAHGGDATTVIVTLDLDTLNARLAEHGIADLAGTPITATQARRLACTARIIPAVLDGAGQPLDIGRAKRLFTPAQRKAIRLRDQGCRAEGCTAPAAWTDAHHLEPWSRGGKTDLDNAVSFCTGHHHRAHDPGYTHTRLPNGDYRFHRRT